MEFIQYGIISDPSYCLQLIHRVDHAEQHFQLRGSEVWYMYTHALYTVLALLLPCLSNLVDPNGFSCRHLELTIVLQGSKEWVSRALRRTSPRREDFYCRDCLSSLISDVEKLWRETTSVHNIISFMKENTWIWNARTFYSRPSVGGAHPVRSVKLCRKCRATEMKSPRVDGNKAI